MVTSAIQRWRASLQYRAPSPFLRRASSGGLSGPVFTFEKRDVFGDRGGGDAAGAALSDGAQPAGADLFVDHGASEAGPPANRDAAHRPTWLDGRRPVRGWRVGSGRSRPNLRC